MRAARGRSRKEKSTQSRERGQGGDFVPFRLPLAESRGGASGGVWGNAPTVPRQINSKGTANKGRRQRSVPASNFARPQTRPQAAFPQDSVKNYNCDAYMEICAAAEGFASADATRGHENRRSLRSPPRPLRCTLSYLNCIGSFLFGCSFTRK